MCWWFRRFGRRCCCYIVGGIVVVCSDLGVDGDVVVVDDAVVVFVFADGTPFPRIIMILHTQSMGPTEIYKRNKKLVSTRS